MTELVAHVPDGEKLVGMVTHEGNVIVATDSGVYKLVGNVLEPIWFKPLPGPPLVQLRGFWSRVWNR